MNFSIELSNFDIIKKCKELKINLTNVFMKDEYKFQFGNFVINLDDSKGPGTHWVLIKCHPEYCLYFDSFGAYPPKTLLKKLKFYKTIYYNKFIIQSLASILCGWYCIAFLHYIENNESLHIIDTFNNFTKLFVNNEQMNDSILILYVSDI